MPAVAPARATTRTPPDILFDDDFSDGFRVTGPDARWFPETAGTHVADDATVHTSPDGLRAVSGRPDGPLTFTRTVGQDTTQDALPGLLDHVKWLVYTTHRTPDGTPGLATPPGTVLTCRARVRARTHGAAGHPFGGQVLNPDDDLRLATAGINALDPQTYLVVDFLLTNRRVYAFYERLPFARGQLGDYAALSYGVPVARRSPEDEHDLALSYDRDGGTVRWLLDGREVFRVDRIGHHLPGREDLMLGHGSETLVAPRQLNFGMGMLTLLDCALPGHSPWAWCDWPATRPGTSTRWPGNRTGSASSTRPATPAANSSGGGWSSASGRLTVQNGPPR